MEVQIGTDPPPQPVPRAIMKKVIRVVFFFEREDPRRRRYGDLFPK